MKKNVFIHFAATLSFLLSGNVLSAQIVPGKSYGELEIGDIPQKVKSIAGTPRNEKNYSEQKKSFEENGYNTKTEVAFFLGFENVMDFHDTHEEYPVFTIYFKDGRVNFFSLSSYIVSEEVARVTGTTEAVHLLDPASVMEATYGIPDIKLNYEGSLDWIYLRKGIGVNIEEDVIRVFYIFSPFSEKTAKKFEKICNK